jgi:hypothetical protein
VAVAEEGRGAPAHPVEDREPLVGPVSHPLPDSTVWVPEGWRGEWREDGTLVLGR